MKALKALMISLALIVGVSMVAPAVTYAAGSVDKECYKTFFGIPPWYEYLTVTYNSASLQCDIDTSGGTDVVMLIALAVIDILIRVAAMLAVVMVVYGGFILVTSQGSPDKIAGARKTILNAVVGLVIALVASQFVKFIAGLLS